MKTVYVGGIGLGKTMMIENLLEVLHKDPNIGIVVLNTSGASGLEFMNQLPQIVGKQGYVTKGYAEIMREHIQETNDFGPPRGFFIPASRHHFQNLNAVMEVYSPDVIVIQPKWLEKFDKNFNDEFIGKKFFHIGKALEDVEIEKPEKLRFNALTKKKTKYQAAPMEDRKQEHKPMNAQKRAKARANRKRKK